MTNQKEEFRREFIRRLIRFSLRIIRLTDDLHRDRKYQIIVDQLIRSATSVGANVVEAKASSSRRYYTHFFEIALKSCNETRTYALQGFKLSPSVPCILNPPG